MTAMLPTTLREELTNYRTQVASLLDALPGAIATRSQELTDEASAVLSKLDSCIAAPVPSDDYVDVVDRALTLQTRFAAL